MIKTCKICQGAIDTLKERHAVLKDMDGKQEKSKGYYHYACLMERIAYKAEAKNTLSFAKNMLLRANNKMQEVGM